MTNIFKRIQFKSEAEAVILPESVLEPFPGRDVEAQPVVQQEQPINPKDDPLYYVDPMNAPPIELPVELPIELPVETVTTDFATVETILEDVPPLSITPLDKQDIDQTVEEYIPMIEKMD